jgi:Fungal chitosanase of glycosyl hydrolase group 75
VAYDRNNYFIFANPKQAIRLGENGRSLHMNRHFKRMVALATLVATLAGPAQAACVLKTTLTVPPQPGLDVKPKHAYGLGDGSAVFMGRLFIDADGAPKAYHRNNAVALDTLDNAGAPGNWSALATDAKECGPAGTPIVQSSVDPAPGYYVAMTSMVDPSVADCRRQKKYVNAQKIPYLALSGKIRKFDYGHNKGALALVVNTKTNKRAFAVFADQAPDYGMGEGSIYLGGKLGYDASPKTGGTDQRQNLIVVFKDSMGFPKDAAAVEAAARSAFIKWGGEVRLLDCMVKVKAAARSSGDLP